MQEEESPTAEGPFVGSRCLAAPGGPGGRWAPATIRRVHEDGTFKVEFDARESAILPHWQGLTRDEVTFGDEVRWPEVHARLCPGGRPLGKADLHGALLAMGLLWVTADQAAEAWDRACQKLFGATPAEAEARVLFEDASYRLFLDMGFSAAETTRRLDAARASDSDPPDAAEKPPSYDKLYWNQTRMGGRDPREIPRIVTTEDALGALGLAGNDEDPSARASFQRFEREEGIRLPATLVEILGRTAAGEAITTCHPNSPELREFTEWTLRRGMREKGLSGDLAISIVTPHQGDHEWVVAFEDGEDDARVYLRWAEGEEDGLDVGETWALTAPGIAFFLWDLAQTGLAWYEDTKFRGGKPVKRSDIGLVLDARVRPSKPGIRRGS